ncbi:MAG: hypothetical protein M3Z23_13010 [Acidobacteriota bacterium]|nr:hypothetical protein [Acidobacteriota bacterium]
MNEAHSIEEIVKLLRSANTDAKQAEELAGPIMAMKSTAGGMFTSSTQVPEKVLAALTDFERDAGPEHSVALPKERQHFTRLLLENPNYFGTIENSSLPSKFPLKNDTTFEELKCVGLHTPTDRLEAVIEIKRDIGYSGGICSTGSYEFVRFFVDLHNTGVFSDVGTAKVNVHDVPGPKPLCYSVFLDFKPIRKFCFSPNVVKVRAILSWNFPTPPNVPNAMPVYGNRVDAEVQIEPLHFFLFGELAQLIDAEQIKIPDPIGPVIQSVNPATKIGLAEKASVSIAEKRRIYAKHNVPAHRFAFAEVTQAMQTPAAFAAIFAEKQSPLLALGLEESEIANVLDKFKLITDGDTSYEQLTCAGLRPDKDLLEAVLTVKQDSGYSGQLCTAGSTEYVAFWMNFNDGLGYQYMGTGTVPVHDLTGVHKGGVQYAVNVKPNLAKFRVPCQFGARVARLRAILSWATPPSTTNPNYLPFWGNRVECNVQIRPGFGEGHVPLIETVGDAAIPIINQADGLATGHLLIASTVFVNESPFGGSVTITGEILNPPSVLAGGAAPFKYKVEVSPSGMNAFVPLLTPFSVITREAIGGFPLFCDAFLNIECPTPLVPDFEGYVPYLEDQTPAHSRHIVDDILMFWETRGVAEGLWDIKLTAKDGMGGLLGTQTVKVRIDNTAPLGDVQITGAVFNGKAIPAKNCGKFPVGSIISGTFSAHDPDTITPAVKQHFGSVSLGILPSGPANGAAIVTAPAILTYPAVSTTGVSGTWTLDTKKMDPCGYVIHLEANDRTNVDSTGNPYPFAKDIGFCLEIAPKV